MKAFLAASFLFACSTAALAQVSVDHPWARATVAQQKTSGAFLEIRAARPMRLVAASTPVAEKVEFHEMRMDNGVMQMRSVAAIELPANQTVAFGPGGMHLMLQQLKRPLSAGEHIPLTLVLESQDRKRETLQVQVPVRPLAHGGASHH